MLSEGHKNQQSFTGFSERVMAFDLSRYTELGKSGNCLEVETKRSNVEIRIRAGIECFIYANDKPFDAVVFTVIQDVNSGSWLIDDFKEIV